MPRGLLPVACLVAAGAVTAHAAARADEPKELKIIATASSTEPFLVRLKKTDSGVVIRSAEELVAHSAKPDAAKDPAVQKATEAELAKFLNVAGIDWGKQMVLVVQGHPSN